MTVILASPSCHLGLEEWLSAAHLAVSCSVFRPDVDEEQIADEKVSCYNCRYRRWLAEGISCLAVRSSY